MIGRGRDLITPADGAAPVAAATAAFSITASPQREILSIATEPAHPRVQDLVGVRAGAASREALLNALGDVIGPPLYQLLDDFPGASLVANWIWTQWSPELVRQMREQPSGGFKPPRPNICIGFADGSSALAALADPDAGGPDRTETTPLENPEDPQGWHEMLAGDGRPIMRRARRIDLWREGDLIRIDSGFQDSGDAPDGARVAVHEYRVLATVDPHTMVVRSLEASPLILPFAECPGASTKVSAMVGHPIVEFRQRVIDMLPGVQGCTHLNDVLRALADVPHLVSRLPGAG